MTDRVNAFTVILDDNYRIDDVEFIRKALLMIKGVSKVEPHIANLADEHIGRMRERSDIQQQIIDLFRKN